MVASLLVMAISSAPWVTGCADGRPSTADVTAEFESRYPRVKVISVTVEEDEVAARSFKITYRYEGDNSPTRHLDIQYMPGPGGEWGANPVAPNQLP